jgi:hypothetical protein
MEIALWVVLGAMAVDLIVSLFKPLSGGNISIDPVLGCLRDIVQYVFPLLLLAAISEMDSTGWIVLAGYYVGAVAVVVKYVKSIMAKL